MIFKYTICLAVLVIRKNLEWFKVHFIKIYDINRKVDFWSKAFLTLLGFEISIVNLVEV